VEERPALPSEDARRILANTAYRSAGDIGAKLASVVFFVVMARELGDEAFGVFTFGLTFALIVTTLTGTSRTRSRSSFSSRFPRSPSRWAWPMRSEWTRRRAM
jgi:hypothetical protein